MEVFEFGKQLNIPKNSALCLGNFDGVHLGHRRLFHAAKECEKWGVLVFTANFRGDKQLTTLSEKLEVVEKLGADYVVCVSPDDEFLSLTGEEFYEILRSSGVGMLVAGYDFRFGKGAFHTSDDLVNWCNRDSLPVHIEGEYDLFGGAVKSTRVRDLIEKGDMPLANELLGYNYFLWGTVEKGLENGRKMGFPTANVAYDEAKLLPPDGVYKGTIEVDKISYKAVINIGKNPTFDAKKRTLEVHIPDFDADIYGERVRVEILEKIRGEIRFDTVEELIGQIKKDVECVLETGEKTKKTKDIWLGVLCPLFYYFVMHLMLNWDYNEEYAVFKNIMYNVLPALPGVALAILLIRNSVKEFFRSWSVSFITSLCLIFIWTALGIDLMIYTGVTGYNEFALGEGLLIAVMFSSYAVSCAVGCVIAGIVSVAKQIYGKRKGNVQ